MDIAVVLEFLKSGRFAQWSALSDKEITSKTVFLLVLATEKRRSELHALTQEVEWISQGESRSVVLLLDPAFVSKTQLSSKGLGLQGPSQCRPSPLRRYLSRRRISYYVRYARCPSTWTEWRSLGRRLRNDWLSHTREVWRKIFSSQTISRYIKEAIILAHKESDPPSFNDMTVRPHSLRHIATSLCAWRGCSLDELL